MSTLVMVVLLRIPGASKMNVASDGQIWKALFFLNGSSRPSSLETVRSQPSLEPFHMSYPARVPCDLRGRIALSTCAPGLGLIGLWKAVLPSRRWRCHKNFWGWTFSICCIVLTWLSEHSCKEQSVLQPSHGGAVGWRKSNENILRGGPPAYVFKVKSVLEMHVTSSFFLLLVCFRRESLKQVLFNWVTKMREWKEEGR